MELIADRKAAVFKYAYIFKSSLNLGNCNLHVRSNLLKIFLNNNRRMLFSASKFSSLTRWNFFPDLSNLDQITPPLFRILLDLALLG